MRTQPTQLIGREIAGLLGIAPEHQCTTEIGNALVSRGLGKKEVKLQTGNGSISVVLRERPLLHVQHDRRWEITITRQASAKEPTVWNAVVIWDTPGTPAPECIGSAVLKAKLQGQ